MSLEGMQSPNQYQPGRSTLRGNHMDFIRICRFVHLHKQNSHLLVHLLLWIGRNLKGMVFAWVFHARNSSQLRKGCRELELRHLLRRNNQLYSFLL